MKFVINCIVFIFCSMFLDALRFRCDYRYTPLGWFKYHEIPATWKEARLQCKFEGGILASPTTAEIKSIMSESFCQPDIFTGIHAMFAKGNYYSIDGIPLANISHEWAQNEPDNKNDAEQCLTLSSDGKFSDVRCDEPRPYMCYRAHSDVDVNICGTPDSEYYFSNQTKKCYKYHTDRRTFERAHFACSAEGGQLLIINSVEELNFINELFTKHVSPSFSGALWNDIFIGFHNWGESADWTTLDGQTLQEAGYDKFSKGQPDNATTGEYCGSMFRNGLLNDMLCENHYSFICEKKPDYPELCDIATAENKTEYVRICDKDIKDTEKRETEPDTEPETELETKPESKFESRSKPESEIVPEIDVRMAPMN